MFFYTTTDFKPVADPPLYELRTGATQIKSYALMFFFWDIIK